MLTATYVDEAAFRLKGFTIFQMKFFSICIFWISIIRAQECEMDGAGKHLLTQTQLLSKKVEELLCAQAENKMPSTQHTASSDANNEVCGKYFTPASGSNKIVICVLSLEIAKYLKGFRIDHIDLNLCTHVTLEGFTKRVGKYHVQLNQDDNNPIDFGAIVQKCKSKGVVVILSIGVADGFPPETYSNFAQTDEYRDQFALSVMNIVNDFGLDGVLALWEYPVFWWNDYSSKHEEDFYNYPKLMAVLKEKLKPKNRILCAFSSGLMLFGQMFDFNKLKFVEVWMLPLYHFDGQWSRYTAISSPVQHVDEFLKVYFKIVPPYKLLLGVPTYNQPVKLADERRNSLRSLLDSSAPTSTKFKTFSDICFESENGGVSIVHNETGKINSYAYKGRHWVSYESAVSILRKAAMVKEKNMTGMFMRFVGQDDFDGKACNCGRNYILRVINEGLRGDGSCVPRLCP